MLGAGSRRSWGSGGAIEVLAGWRVTRLRAGGGAAASALLTAHAAGAARVGAHHHVAAAGGAADAAADSRGSTGGAEIATDDAAAGAADACMGEGGERIRHGLGQAARRLGGRKHAPAQRLGAAPAGAGGMEGLLTDIHGSDTLAQPVGRGKERGRCCGPEATARSMPSFWALAEGEGL